MDRQQDPLRKKRWLAANIAVSLGVLGVFKYFDFFIESCNGLLSLAGLPVGLPTLRIVLPIGVSFFTFHAISYTMDVYRGKVKPDLSAQGALDFMVYSAFFPHLVAGPIVRAVSFLPQLRARHAVRIEDVHGAFALILAGLFKKMVLSTYLQANIVDNVMASPFNFSSWEVLLAIYGFSVQIYCDFSGYTDIAIGTAQLLGFRFPENFNQPYAAVSIQDFWRRWHMTLSGWLRDYLYIPLGGSRHGVLRRYGAVMVTMLLGGLWHGASLNFIVWGGLHGVAIVLHGVWRQVVERVAGWGVSVPPVVAGAFRAVSTVLTFHLVTFLWVPFYHREFSRAVDVFLALTRSTRPVYQLDLLVVAAVVVGIGMNFAGGRVREAYLRFQGRSTLPWRFALNAALAFLILRASPDTVPPFIYFQF
jgi:D-alanyl-lipoteichoic acid acyltransferase DltB (MBOAT superfamily)